jgi:hypothetical protein
VEPDEFDKAAGAACGCVLCLGNVGGTRKLCDVGERILAYGVAQRQVGALAVMSALSDGQVERLRRALADGEVDAIMLERKRGIEVVEALVPHEMSKSEARGWLWGKVDSLRALREPTEPP